MDCPHRRGSYFRHTSGFVGREFFDDRGCADLGQKMEGEVPAPERWKLIQATRLMVATKSYDEAALTFETGCIVVSSAVTPGYEACATWPKAAILRTEWRPVRLQPLWRVDEAACTAMDGETQLQVSS